MEFQEVIKTRRSIRSYQDKDIPEEILKRILETARIAPSGNNWQPWHFILVKDQEKKEKIAQSCYQQKFISQAPVVIVACGQKYPNQYQPYADRSYLIDVTIALDHLILAARNEGVGSCWIGAFQAEPIRKLLEVPENFEVVMVVPLGYPAHQQAFCQPGYRKDLTEIVSQEKFGQRT
ncbi:MAG: nitroreductase family protein [Candidatus Omnitrophica bacterium]|nr:nitroreductase family protein [Candidatus Omnitrophota bacterium]